MGNKLTVKGLVLFHEFLTIGNIRVEYYFGHCGEQIPGPVLVRVAHGVLVIVDYGVLKIVSEEFVSQLHIYKLIYAIIIGIRAAKQHKEGHEADQVRRTGVEGSYCILLVFRVCVGCFAYYFVYV